MAVTHTMPKLVNLDSDALISPFVAASAAVERAVVGPLQKGLRGPDARRA